MFLCESVSTAAEESFAVLQVDARSHSGLLQKKNYGGKLQFGSYTLKIHNLDPSETSQFEATICLSQDDDRPNPHVTKDTKILS